MSHARETTLTFFVMYLSPLSPRFTFWLIFIQSYMLPLSFIGLRSYLKEMKRRTSRRVVCKSDNSHFLRYVLISLDIRCLPFG